MILFDTHCHLNATDFDEDVEGYLLRAHEAGVKFLAIIGWDLTSSKKAIEIATKYEGVFAVVGIHPSDVFNYAMDVLEEIETMVNNPKVVAIGEIGLDYYWHKTEQEHQTQKEWFVKQIEMANRHHLPIVVHMRDAAQDTIELLKIHPVKHGGVMHCYSSSTEMAFEFIKLGFYISLGGPVTFKNAKEPKRVAISVPLEKLLIETDSPYLAPHPYRGKQNQSAYLPLVLKEIADLREINQEDLATKLLENSFTLFHVEHN